MAQTPDATTEEKQEAVSAVSASCYQWHYPYQPSKF
ncbi:hypothetical protein ACO2E2_04885 [Staphylococcus epidermidis]